MASTYFPPLDKVFSGESYLIPWRAASQLLTTLTETNSQNETLTSFLTDNASLALLTNAHRPFTPPSADSKRDFENRTAPIHVSPNGSNSDYNVEQMKQDALWLSKELDMEETTALRAVALEWQERRADLLLGRSGTAGGQEAGEWAQALGVSTMGQSRFALGKSLGVGTAAATLPSSDEESVRRPRIVKMALEEKSAVSAVSATLKGLLLATGDLAGSPSLSGTAPFLGRKEALESLLAAFRGTEFERADASTITAYITAFDERMRKLDAGVDSWPKVVVGDPLLEALYMDCALSDAVNDLRSLLAQIAHSNSITEAQPLRDWFRTMDEVAFFQMLPTQTPMQEALLPLLQGLVSVVSVALLKLPESLAYLQDAANARPDSAEYPDLRASAYIVQKPNNDCVRDITLKLADAADKGIRIAGPAIYAWSLITTMIRDVARIHQELRVEQEGEDDLTNARATSARPLSSFEQQLEQIKDVRLPFEVRDDPPLFLAKAAVDALNVYATIQIISTALSAAFASAAECPTSFFARLPLLDLVGEGLSMVTYGEELLGAVFDLLDPKTPNTSVTPNVTAYFVNKILADQEGFHAAVVEQAKNRYPYELSPFLRLCTILCKGSQGSNLGGAFFVMDEILESQMSFTTAMPHGFKSYELTREDEDINAFILTDDLSIFTQRKAGYRALMPVSQNNDMMLTDGEQDGNVKAVAQGTLGLIVSESRLGTKPAVVRLEHAHSSMAYLGLLLTTALPKSELVFALPGHDIGVDRSTAAEIINLATALLVPDTPNSALEHTTAVLEHFSKALPDQSHGFVSTVTTLFELVLLSHNDQQQGESSLELLAACVAFLQNLLPTHASRVWSFLSRSSLLGLAGGPSTLANIVTSSEVPNAEYTFLNRCARLYRSLIEDSVTGAVKNQPQNSSNGQQGRISRHDSGSDIASTATPERAIAAVLGAYQNIMLEFFQSMAEWKFAVPEQRCQVITDMTKGFEMVLRWTYGIGEAKGQRKLTAFLQASAAAVLTVLAPDAEAGDQLASVTSPIRDAMALSEIIMPAELRAMLTQQTGDLLRFLTTLLRSVRLCSDVRASGLANGLVKLMPAFANLVAGSPSLKRPIVVLLSEMVPAMELSSKEPPSLLSQMRPEPAKSFLATLTQLDKPFLDPDTERSCWNFLSTIMDSKQQWFSLYLLTGTLPKDRIKAADSGNKGRPLLSYALDQLTDLNAIEPERAIAMLAFVAASQRSWVWAANEVRNHSTFLKNSIDWLNTLQPPKRGSGKPMLETRELRMAAHICETLAVNIHSGLEVGDVSVVKLLIPKLSYLRDYGVQVDTYNRSLHQNLTENFSRKYSGCTLQHFERTAANPPLSGDETYRGHFYDTALASRMLSHDSSWRGKSTRQGGFRDEMERANANLAVVDAQTALLQAWRNLATTLSQCLEQEAALRVELAATAEKCLCANLNAPLDEPAAADLLQVRGDMAFVLVSKLVGAKAEGGEMKALLPAAWDLVRASPVDFDVATAAEDLGYYRALLQILYLSLQPHVYSATPTTTATDHASNTTHLPAIDATATSTAKILVQITHTICTAFRALSANLHSPSTARLTLPSDFALLTALLNTCTSLPTVSRLAAADITHTVASSSIIRTAASLYSWSDTLPTPSGTPGAEDPIYAPLALSFLLTLSTLPSLAHVLATENVLADLANANLSSYFRKPGGKGPFDFPLQMFVIWNEGFLPLCLNLLDHVGARMAPEVVAFLNGFAPQLKRAETALRLSSTTRGRGRGMEGAVSLGLVQEANALALIKSILSNDAVMASAEGVDAGNMEMLAWDGEVVQEDMRVLRRGRRRGLAERVVAVGEREGLLAGLPAREGEGSRLVEDVEGELMRGDLGE